jgi:hypothetical protein
MALRERGHVRVAVWMENGRDFNKIKEFYWKSSQDKRQSLFGHQAFSHHLVFGINHLKPNLETADQPQTSSLCSCWI